MCAECKLDFNGRIVCKPCAMPMVEFLSGTIYGGCDSGPTIGGNVTCAEYIPPERRIITSLRNTVMERVKKANLTPQEENIRKYILKSMAKEGKPPSVEEIRIELKINSISTVESAIAKLHDADILSLNTNKITTVYPFSVARTNHRVIFDDGQEVYALCAIDALGIHSMLNRDTTIKSRCVECNRELTIVIKDGRIISADPENIVVYLNNRSDCNRVADTCCPHINFFCSKDELYQWIWVNPEFENGEICSLEDALECGIDIFKNLQK
jgi:hypothetical protein